MTAIKIDSEVLHGQPHIEGTRIGVANILDALLAIDAINAVQRQYPQLSHVQIFEAIDYARKVMENIPQIRGFNSVLIDAWDNDGDAVYDEM